MTWNILPYANGEARGWSVSDEAMGYVWDKIKRANLVKRVWPTGEVRTADDWFTMIKNPTNIVNLVTGYEDVVAFAWLNGISHNHAFAHYCTFPEAWGRGTVGIMRQCLKYWFGFKDENGNPMLEVILGRTPSDNRLAIKFLDRIGMEVLGEIPGIGIDVYKNKKVGLVFSYIKRESLIGGK